MVLRGPPVCHPLALHRVLACADHWNACAPGRGPVARDPGFQLCAGRLPRRISGKAAPDVAPDRYRHWENGKPRFFVPWEAFASVPAWFFETRPPSCVLLSAWSLALARRHAARGVRLSHFVPRARRRSGVHCAYPAAYACPDVWRTRAVRHKPCGHRDRPSRDARSACAPLAARHIRRATRKHVCAREVSV